MPDINLTSGNDTYVHPTGLSHTNVYGLEGDDRITFTGNANINGGPGNDIIVNLADQGNSVNGGAAYWNSPAAVTIDLEAGYALDGWGGRDSLTNIRHTHTSGRDGDVVYGSQYRDDIFLNGFNWNNRSTFGQATVDLRGGSDLVQISLDARIKLTMTSSADGKVITVAGNNYQAVLSNVETVRLNLLPPDGNWSNRTEQNFRPVDLIDFSKVGSETLLAPGQRGWSGGTVTYSFMSAVPSYGGPEGGTGFAVPSASYQGAVRSILNQLSGQIGVTFTEVPDSVSAYGQLRFGSNQQSATKGYSFIPGTVNDDRAGDVWLDIETLSALQTGQEGWQVLLHEIGHALGLSHPIAEGSNTTATVLLNQWNHNGYTVMSPNQTSSGMWQSWFGPLDMQALGHLYGSQTSASNPGNDVYRMSNGDGFHLSSLRDSGGEDTLDASSLVLGAYINLLPGSFNSVGYTLNGTASVDNLYIDPGTVIERAVGTPFDDVLLGNSANNLFWPGKGNDWVDGKSGFNTVLYDVARSTQTVQRLSDGSGAWVVADTAGTDGSDTLLNVSRVYFSDQRVALDVDSRAGEAARIAVTVFGSRALQDATLAGIVLRQLDSGASSPDAYGAALASSQFRQMAGGTDHLSFVKQMFRNLVNVEATNAMAQPFVDQFLASGAYTQTSFAQAVSSIAPVDMVGLSQTGLNYIY
jgi:hypothetical protein